MKNPSHITLPPLPNQEKVTVQQWHTCLDLASARIDDQDVMLINGQVVAKDRDAITLVYYVLNVCRMSRAEAKEFCAEKFGVTPAETGEFADINKSLLNEHIASGQVDAVELRRMVFEGDGAIIDDNAKDPDMYGVFVHLKGDGGVDCVGEFSRQESAAKFAGELSGLLWIMDKSTPQNQSLSM